MSDTESFIEEVNEEVRRDKLFRVFRRYGWIAILLVVLLVGGAAWNEWQKSQARAEAEALGDGILTALEADGSAAQAEALRALPTTGDASALTRMMAATAEYEAGDTAGAIETLGIIAADPSVPAEYRDLAVLKQVLMGADTLSVEDRLALLDPLTISGRPYRLLAEEQIALSELASGDTDAAISRLRTMVEDTELTAGLRQRVSQLIVALGGDPSAP